MFAQIASGFGLLVDVDWSTLFKTFYEVVRLKIACRDPSKIPTERLYEMQRCLFLISFSVEDLGNPAVGKVDGGDDGDEGGDDNDDEADYLDEDMDHEKKSDKSEYQSRQLEQKTPEVSTEKVNSGHKTVPLMVFDLPDPAGQMLTSGGNTVSGLSLDKCSYQPQ